MKKPIQTSQGTKDDILHVVDECRGIYAPQAFCEKFNFEDFQGISRDDWDTVQVGPDDEYYWDAWNNIETNATAIFDPTTFSLYGGRPGDGKRFIKYTIRQDGSIFLVPKGVCSGCHESDCEQCNPDPSSTEEDAA